MLPQGGLNELESIVADSAKALFAFRWWLVAPDWPFDSVDRKILHVCSMIFHSTREERMLLCK